nr:hypothetical protein [Armatimonadota bacterium]
MAVWVGQIRFWAFLCLLLVSVGQSFAAPVSLLQTPNDGIQPQAVVDAGGTLHLLYYKGDPAHGDLFYVHKKLGQDGPFSVPLRVNSQSHSAIATGTIRGGQIAVGRN